MNKKITIIGAGYVGMSLATLLSKNNSTTIYDIDKEKIKKIKSGKPTIDDKVMIRYWKENKLNLSAKTSRTSALKSADIIIICTPTDYDEKKNYFDTSSVESIITESLKNNLNASIVIKSTVPVGFTEGRIRL